MRNLAVGITAQGRRLLLCASVALSLVYLPVPAHALVIALDSNVSYSHSVVPGVGGVLIADDPDSSAIAATSELSPATGNDGLFSGGTGIGQARVNALGFSAVRADAGFAEPGTAPDRNSLISQTIFRQTETNTTGSAQDYQMSVLLKDAQLQLSNFAGTPPNLTNPFSNPASMAVGARVNYTVEVNGTPIFAADAQLFGFPIGTSSHTLDKSASMDGVAPDGSTVSSDLGGTFFVGGGGFITSLGYDFDDIIGTLDVGNFLDGETFEVVATMTAEVTGLPFEFGGIAYIADPLNLSGGSGSGLLTITSSGPPSTVPEPATLALFGLGLVGLAVARRRRAVAPAKTWC